MDFRLFIDEVGNSDLSGAATDANIRYLSLTGLLTTKNHHASSITTKLNRVKELLPSHSTANPLVVHRREIVRREGKFTCLREEAVQTRFDEAILDCIAQSPFLITTVQIDKKAHLEQYDAWQFDPYHYCLRCLVERYVLYLKRHQHRGDVVIEPRYKKADKKVKASFERIYDDGTENIPARIIQKHLLSRDIQFFDKSANIAGLQIVDLIAHPSARYMRFKRDGLELPPDFGRKVADILVEKKYARNPHNRIIDGWGTKWLPK
jgi:hypothetical protein